MSSPLSWTRHAEHHCEQIRDVAASFKIVLKTRNDPFFLDSWITHHAGIVGIRNLVVFDNLSSETAVQDTYARYPELHVISYDGYHNNLQAPNLVRPFYEALAASCTAFVFLDTDEFLVRFEDGRFVADPATCGCIAQDLTQDFIPAAWLNNVKGRRDAFVLGQDDGVLVQGLKWGKPIIASRAFLTKNIIHNTQLVAQGLRPVPNTSYFVLHCSMLNPHQRIRANLAKLASAGLRLSVEGALALQPDPQTHSREAIRFLREIAELAAAGERPLPSSPVGAGHLLIAQDHTLHFLSDQDRRRFHGYLASPEPYLARALHIAGPAGQMGLA
jgi:hypothetical protein